MPEELRQEVSEQNRIRLEKLRALQAEGRDPYRLTRYDQTHRSKEILDNFEALDGQTVSIAGRMMSRRVMGKASFAHVLDRDGQIQIYVRRDDVGEEAYKQFKDFDLGDVIGVKGVVFRTKMGEVSVHAQEVTLLTKCLHPLPEKFHGLKDMDTRYRQRYLDMIVNPEVRDTFVKRSQIIKAIREFMDDHGYLEVDTPVLGTLEIGAAARPFVTHHNALDIDMYLRIETELHLKRLVVGGLERVYEVGRIFRNEGMDTRHNPEFTSVEMYQAYTDYHGMMDLIEELYKYVANKVCGTTDVPYQGEIIHLGGEWARMTMKEAVKKFTGVDYADWADDAAARAACKAAGLEPEAGVQPQTLSERSFLLWSLQNQWEVLLPYRIPPAGADQIRWLPRLPVPSSAERNRRTQYAGLRFHRFRTVPLLRHPRRIRLPEPESEAMR